MKNTLSHVRQEIEDHKTDLTTWVSDIETTDCPNEYKSVAYRFIRDCRTLIGDLDTTDTPRDADLSDFSERRSSLEVQYYNLVNQIK